MDLRVKRSIKKHRLATAEHHIKTLNLYIVLVEADICRQCQFTGLVSLHETVGRNDFILELMTTAGHGHRFNVFLFDRTDQRHEVIFGALAPALTGRDSCLLYTSPSPRDS